MATKRWLCNAPAIEDLWTITLSGTVASQTYSITINSKPVTYAAGSSDTVANILTGLVANVAASSTPEFNELSAAVASASTMTLKGNIAGVPSAVSVSTSGGATFSIVHTTSATGPSDFTNALNWSGGVAPANSDTLVFDNGSIDCLYNISSTLTGITLNISQGYSGTIGLPFINDNGSTSYAEYRTTSLTLAGGTAVINGPSLRRCNLAFGANTTTVRVLATGQRPDKYVPVVLITGGNGSSELSVTQGDVGVAFYAGTAATFPMIRSGYLNQAASDVKLTLGSGSTLTTITKNGGEMTVFAAVTTLTQQTAGGTVTIADGAVATIDASGGTVIYNSTGTLGTITLSNSAILNFDQDPRAKTITNPILIYGDNATVQDNQKVVNSGVLRVTANKTSKINVGHGSDNVMSLT